MASTQLRVRVISGQLWEKARHGPFMPSPYCCVNVEIGNKDLEAAGKTYLHKTLYCKKTLEPVWGETFQVESHSPDQEYLRFYVFHKEALIKDHLICWTEIPLSDIRAAGHIAKGYYAPVTFLLQYQLDDQLFSVNLIDAKGRSDQAGIVQMEVTYGSGYPGGGPPPQAYYPPQGYYPPQQLPPQPAPVPPPQEPPAPEPPKEQPAPEPPKEQLPPEPEPVVVIDSETKKLASSLGIDELHLQDAYLKFQEVDADHSGTISFEELKILLHVTVAKALHDDVLDRYAHVEFSSVDSDHNGEISFQEFLVVYSKLMIHDKQ